MQLVDFPNSYLRMFAKKICLTSLTDAQHGFVPVHLPWLLLSYLHPDTQPAQPQTHNSSGGSQAGLAPQ